MKLYPVLNQVPHYEDVSYRHEDASSA